MPAVRRGTPAYERLVEEERLIVAATENIYRLMRDEGISKAELAKRIGRSRAFVSQILTGERNLTLRTLADVCHALGYRLDFSTVRLKRHRLSELR